MIGRTFLLRLTSCIVLVALILEESNSFQIQQRNFFSYHSYYQKTGAIPGRDKGQGLGGTKNDVNNNYVGYKSSSLRKATQSKSTLFGMRNDIDWDSIRQQIGNEMNEFMECASIVTDTILSSFSNSTFNEIIKVCDELDAVASSQNKNNKKLTVMETLTIRKRALEFRRYELLVKLMKNDYNAYVATASFLSPTRVSRIQLPNVQDVPYSEALQSQQQLAADSLVHDCTLVEVKYNESPLDVLLLNIFRKLVAINTGGVTSEKNGIIGLLDQGRKFMLLPNQTAEAQHNMVYRTLGGLMTPVLPPFYRIFMSGIVPNIGSQWDGKQFGPWFYAPFLTSFVTPTFFNFLVGPSSINRRKDGSYGGLLVEKCKFLQESNCKGLCLNQCKIPAQEFFQKELGLALTVSPNFVTQECQWNFGEKPLPTNQDPSFPKGCIAGCESRKFIAETGLMSSTTATLCM